MTPSHLSVSLYDGTSHQSRTKRMPQDQCQLWHLLPLLAQFQKRSFPRVLIQEIGDVGHCAPVLFGDVFVASSLLAMCRGKGGHAVMCACNPVVVLLLGSRCGRSDLLSMLVMT